MSDLVVGWRYAQRVQEMRNQYQQVLGTLNQLAEENRRQVDALTKRRTEALYELCVALLPDLRRETLARATALTGYLPLAEIDADAELARRRPILEQRIAEIEADRRYRDRLLLRAPRIGLLPRQLAELEDFRTPLVALLTRAEHPRLQQLLASRYGTPAYSVPFWRVSYYQDWKAADEILERFEGKLTFAALADELRSAQESCPVYERKIEQLQQEIGAGELLESDHDAKQKELAALPQVLLESVRGQLGRYLDDLDLVAIGDRLENDPVLYGMARRFMGIGKQIQYLQKSGQHYIEGNRSVVRQSLTKLDRELNKMMRPKNRSRMFSSQALTGYGTRSGKVRQNVQRYSQTSGMLSSFDRYDDGRIDDDFLWWSLMTRDRVAGLYIDEVARYQAAHPERRRQQQQPDFDDGLDSLAAAAELATRDSAYAGRDIS